MATSYIICSEMIFLGFLFIFADHSTIFVKLTDIDPLSNTAVTMFINFIDNTTGLPMGTIQPFGAGDNRLYTYDPLKDVNDPPPTVRDLLLCIISKHTYT